MATRIHGMSSRSSARTRLLQIIGNAVKMDLIPNLGSERARVSTRGVIGVKRLKTSLRTPLRPPGRQNQSVRCAVVFAQTRTCKIRLTRWSALVMLPELTLKRPMHHAKGECANNDIQLVPLVVLTRKRKRKAAGEIAEKKKD
jgi:hypothetical protein